MTVGDFKLNDGVSSDAYPLETRIVGNHFHEIGVTGTRRPEESRADFAGNTIAQGSSP